MLPVIGRNVGRAQRLRPHYRGGRCQRLEQQQQVDAAPWHCRVEHLCCGTCRYTLREMATGKHSWASGGTGTETTGDRGIQTPVLIIYQHCHSSNPSRASVPSRGTYRAPAHRRLPPPPPPPCCCCRSAAAGG